MFKEFKALGIFFLLGFITLAPTTALAEDRGALADILKKVDQLVCTSPQKILGHYAKNMVIISDDRRIATDHRIQNYETMIAELRGMKCEMKRTVLAGNVGGKVGYLLVDEMISVTSRQSTDERQHSVCTYGFVKNKGTWKINHEHCSSLPDYSIVPGDDALYYFHNPVY